MSREEKNKKAYNDVCECTGPSMRDDPEYMQFYCFWYPLGAEAREDRLFDEHF